MTNNVNKKGVGFLRKIRVRIANYLLPAENKNSKNALLENLILMIREKGFTPNLIVDVGANHGTWARLWKGYFPNSKFILIEPQNWLKSSFQDLLDDRTVYLPVGVGKFDGTLPFTVYEGRDDSSTFVMSKDQARSLGFKQIDLQIMTLNSIISKQGGQIPEIVKIDAEGMDLDVLEGASELWNKTEMFLIEANINGEYKQNNILNILNFMDKAGYKMFDITDLNRPFGLRVLWLVELVFVKRGGFFDNLKWT
jgi:FkbM family methyltransferase